VQDYIYRNSLYLREPQYKTLIRTEYLSVSLERTPSAALRRELTAALDKGRSDSPILDDRSALLVLRDEEADNRPLGCLVMRQVNSGELFAVLGDTAQADYIREHSAGRICLILGIFTSENGLRDAAQLLITDALSQSLNEDCCYAVYASGSVPTMKPPGCCAVRDSSPFRTAGRTRCFWWTCALPWHFCKTFPPH
jgi:hypothetical protein